GVQTCALPISNIGTYLFILLLAFFGIMSIGQFSYQNLFSKIGDGMKIIFNGLKNIFVKGKDVLSENIQFESKDPQKRSEKKTNDKKETSDTKKEKKYDSYDKKRMNHIHIMSIKQTVL